VTTPPVALTIAGSDSGGAAGIQADLKTFAALGVFGTCAITAVTAQSSTEVRCVTALETEMVLAQIDAVLDDLPVAATKTGMLPTEAIIAAIGSRARAGRLPALVVDPVLVASTGRRLLEAGAEAVYLEHLVPFATVVTPNLREAEVLLGTTIGSVHDQREAAQELVARGARWAVVKGGHATVDAGDQAVDVVADAHTVGELRAPRLASTNTHGSGCTFASAIAAGLACGLAVDDAIRRAKSYVHDAIERSARWQLGAGHGPLDHFGWNTKETP